jgi:hypothetical protein
MNLSKQHYLESIRADSAYPVYRGTINTVALLFYIVAAVCGLGAVIGGLGAMTNSVISGLGIMLFGLTFAALYYFLGRLFKEAALIVADIGDSIVDTNSRTHSA